MKVLVTAVLCVASLFVAAQHTLRGRVLDVQSKPLAGATITLASGNFLLNAVSTDDGFLFHDLKNGRYLLSVGFVGMKPFSKTIALTDPITTVEVVLEESVHFLEPLEIKAIRANVKSPFTQTNIGKKEIAAVNLGQDLPFILNQTPSVVVNSDAGNGVGYTGIRIRGSDATRINVTMNGIPYNDAESQGTFFVDLPDIASSLSSIQIQRGVGTSSNGAGAFGATINLSTNEFIDSAYAEINNSIGSFNTWKHTFKAGTGLVNNHFTFDARLSKLTSDGYIERASSDLNSIFLSGAYFNANSSIRFNVISGKEKTYQAWNGVSEEQLKTNRRYNSSGTERPGAPYDNETDNYRQDHFQSFFNHKFSESLAFNTALFLTRGFGYYEQYKAGVSFADYGLPNVVTGTTTISETDLVRQLWLDNSFYGQVASLHYKKNNNEITLGGGWNTYDGRHFGKLIWGATGVPKDYTWYDNDAIKKDKNMYAKWQSNLNTNLSLFGDLQYRNVNYAITGFRNNPSLNINHQYHFINPKAGITYNKNGWQSYISYALANKEPNRDDFEAAVKEQPQHETLHNIEIGTTKRNRHYTYGANVYLMAYQNQLVLTGKINDVGAYTRINIAKSYRRGVELQGSATITSWFNFSGNLSLSRNKISEGQEFIDDYDNGGQKVVAHTNKDISFSPYIISNGVATFTPGNNLQISLISKYVGRQFLDNTQNIGRSLNPYYLQDARLIYSIKNKLLNDATIMLQANNIFNKLYEPNGYTFSYIYNGQTTTENFYYPMAGTNFMLGINIRL